MVFERFFKDEIGFREGIVYRKFMLIPAILAWAFSNVVWLGMILLWFCYYELSIRSIAQYSAIVLLSFFLTPILTKTLYAYLSGRRMWNWGRERFYNKRHMAYWMNAIGSSAFELVVQVDDKLKQDGPILRLMRP